MANQGVLEVVLDRFSKALQPLVHAAEEQPAGVGIIRLAYEVGYDLEGALDANTATTLATAVSSIYTDIRAIVDDPAGAADQVPDLVLKIKSFVDAMSALDAVAPPNADIGPKLLELLLIDFLERESPSVTAIFVLLGIFEYTPVPMAGTVPAYTKRTVAWQRFSDLLDPGKLFKDLYHWGDATLDSDVLLRRFNDVLWSLGLPSTFADTAAVNDGVLTVQWSFQLGLVSTTLGAKTRYLPADNQKLPGLSTAPEGTASITQSFPFGGGWQFTILTKASASSGYGVMLRPPGTVDIGALPGQPPVTWSLVVQLSVGKAATGGGRIIVFGSPDSIHLESTSAAVIGTIEAGGSGADAGIELSIVGGRLVITAGQGDGFLQKILPPEGFAVEFDTKLGWSGKRGLYFQGSAGLETTLPIQLNLGPLRIPSLYLRMRALSSGEFGLTVAAGPSIDLSVLVATVDRLGVEAAITPGPKSSVRFLFVPPTQLGILIDAGPVVGGGFLEFDPDNGRYAGMLQLEIYSISLTAIGLLDTKLPGGVSGFSFLIIITAKFPPIQLGFGFTLNGVGGLAGINRTIVVDALQAGVRAGAVDHILFPENPIRDAQIIISDLRTFFPPAEGRYVFGPMAIIGWGSPTLIDVQLGIILEVPSPVRLVLLGQLSAILPDKAGAIVEIHLDVLGVIDFGAQRMGIDASIHDSRVAAFALYGDMAMRLAWGEKPNFALAVGGWNPHFQPPEGFPELRRLTLALGAGENPRITLQCYLAITSNSVQAGARAELYAEVSGFSISGWIGFDALFIFDPFSFRTDFSAGVELRRGSSTLASIHLDATLTGTSPYHAWGKASFSVLFFSVSVPFDATFGPEKRITPPQRNPWDLLEPAIREQQNWNAVLPPGAHAVVALKAPPAGPPFVLLDPVGTATLRQKVVPLGFTISKFGESTPVGPDHYTISQVTLQGAPTNAWQTVKDVFARGQFQKLSDHDKLTFPSFEPLDAGMALSSDAVALGPGKGREVVYETVILDSEFERRPDRPYRLTLRHQQAMMERGVAGGAPMRSTGFGRFAGDPRAPAPFTLDDEQFVVVSAEDLAVRADISAPATRGQASDELARYLSTHPEERGQLQVVSQYEVEVGV
jgi:hypothetical protein